MKQKLQLLALICLTGFVSCKRMELKKGSNQLTTNSLVVPLGFKYENSRNIHFTVSVNDTRFGNANNRILIYDGDPAAGGRLILNGFATTKTAYAGNSYLSNRIKSVYIVKMAVNNTSLVTIIPVERSNVSVMMGI